MSRGFPLCVRYRPHLPATPQPGAVRHRAAGDRQHRQPGLVLAAAGAGGVGGHDAGPRAGPRAEPQPLPAQAVARVQGS